MSQLGSSGNRLLAAAAYRPIGLARNGSAPGSLLSSIADSVIGGGSGGGNLHLTGIEHTVAGSFFSNDSPCLTSESSCRAASGASPDLDCSMSRIGGYRGSFPSTGYGGCGDTGGGSHLFRHSSSPAGFFANLLVDSGHSAEGNENLSQVGVNDDCMKRQRLCSQWSFSHPNSLSQISDINNIVDMGKNVGHGNSSTEVSGNFGCVPYITGNLPHSPWDGSSSIVASPPNKRGKVNNGDVFTNLNSLESQASLPCTSMEMEAVENYLNMQQDSVHCKLRAKRGFATHPRSIAERERRTRISKRLRRLEDLVPNMDKQTNTSDMLDLALHYIKELQARVKKLNQERSECMCTTKNDGI